MSKTNCEHEYKDDLCYVFDASAKCNKLKLCQRCTRCGDVQQNFSPNTDTPLGRMRSALAQSGRRIVFK